MHLLRRVLDRFPRTPKNSRHIQDALRYAVYNLQGYSQSLQGYYPHRPSGFPDYSAHQLARLNERLRRTLLFQKVEVKLPDLRHLNEQTENRRISRMRSTAPIARLLRAVHPTPVIAHILG